MTLSSSVDIFGRFHDLISGPLGKAGAAITRFMGIAKKAQGTNVIGMNPADIRARSAELLRHARVIDAVTAAQNRNAASLMRQVNATTLMNRANRGGGLGGGGRGGHRFSGWTPVQQSLAALGGYGYALGRGGPGVLAGIGVPLGAVMANKNFANFDYQMRLLRRAGNIDGTRIEDFRKNIQELSIKYGKDATDIAQGSINLALGGMRGSNLMVATEELTRALSLWEGVDAEEAADSMAKMIKVFYEPKHSAQDIAKNTPKWLRQFTEQIDFIEDNFPGTKAKNVMAAFFRSQGQVALSGMDPMQALSQIGLMLTMGEQSGERTGTRLRLFDPRFANAFFTGMNGKKKVDFKGIRRKDIVKNLETGNFTLGLAMLMEDLAKKTEGLPVGKRGQEITKFLRSISNPEAAAYMAPMFANLDEALLHMAIGNNAVRDYLFKNNPDWVDRIKRRSAQTKHLAEMLEKTVGTDVGIADGTSDTNLRITMESSLKAMQGSWQAIKAAFERSGALVNEYLHERWDVWNKLRESAVSLGDTIDSELSAAQRDRKISSGEAFPSILSPNTPASSVNPYGPNGAAMGRYRGASGKGREEGWVFDPVNGLGRWYFDDTGALRWESKSTWRPADGKEVRVPGSNEHQGALDKYISGRDSWKPPVPIRNPLRINSQTTLPMVPNVDRLNLGFSTSQPGIPPIVNQHMGGEPIVNQIPPPQVNVINGSPGVVNVNVSVSPAMQTIMRNPGTAAQSGSQNDTAGSKTGVVGR